MSDKQIFIQDDSDGEQLPLIPDGEIEQRLILRESEQGEYTLERTRQQRPELIPIVAHLLASGYGYLRIAALCHCSHHTVSAIAEQETETIAMHKARLARLARHGAALAFEAAIDDLADETTRAKISSRDKALMGAIFTDKSLVLEGEASVILGTSKQEFTHEDLNAYLETLPSAGDTRQTGVSAAGGGQKGELPGAVVDLDEDGEAVNDRSPDEDAAGAGVDDSGVTRD